MRQLLRAARDTRKALSAIGLLCVACVGTSSVAWAGSILQVNVGKGGTVSYGAGEHHAGLRGNGINVNQLIYGASMASILMGHLTFHEQGFATSQGGRLIWGPGGSLSVRGCADLNGDGKCEKGDVRGALITGTFLSTEIVQQGGKLMLIAQIVDQIDPRLAARLGLQSTTYHGVLELFLANSGCCRGRVHDIVQGGYLKDFAVPEPLSIVLLGAGLMSLVFVRMLMTRMS